MSPLVFTFVVLGVYLVGLEAVGWVAYRRAKQNTGDYFLSGRSVGLVALTGTTMASLLSTGTVVSNAPNFYQFGTQYFWVIFFGWTLSCILFFGLRFWKLGKRFGFITPGQLMKDLYASRRVQLAFAVVGLACLMPYATAQLVAIGKVFVGLSQGSISYEWGVLLAAAAMGLFLLAGARAVIWTDVVQGFLFTLLLAIAAVLVVHWSGGFGTMIDNFIAARPDHTDYAEIDNWDLIEKSFAIPALFMLPYMWQRMFMASSARDLSRMAVITPPLYIVIILSSWVIGVGTHTLYPGGLVRPDGLLGTLFAEHAPYFGGLILVAAFSAGISTVDSQLLTAASLVTKDLRRPKPSDTEALEFRIGRFTTLAMLVGVTVVALFLEERPIIDLVLLGIYLSMAFVTPTLATFTLRRCSEPAVYWGVVLGASGYAFRAIFDETALAILPRAGLASWSVGLSTLAVVIGILVAPCKEPDPRRFEGI